MKNENYDYDIWDGKKVIGIFRIKHKIIADHLLIQDGFSEKRISIPVSYKISYDDGVSILFKRCLDVSKKSKRQVNVIKNHSGFRK